MRRSTPSTVICACLLAFSLVAAGCSQFLEDLTGDLPRLAKKDLRFKPPQSSFIYDRDGKLVTTFHGVQNRTVIPLERIPEHVQRAVIAIEDERFYEHHGVDTRAIFRAFVSNVKEGGVAEGGSTITQQYVKQTIIAPDEIAERTLNRKIHEAALARQIETKLSKDEILARYLNTVYFGSGAYGIQAASRTFFNKPARKLTLSEAALLAGLIQSPEDHNPFRNLEDSLARRRLVLGKMKELGWVTPEKADKADGRKPKLQKPKKKKVFEAPYFIDYVTRLIAYDPRFKALGKTWKQRQQKLYTGGLRIHTTVDLNTQRAAEEAVQGILSEPGDPYASLVAIEPKTGFVRAMVGGRNWFARRKKDKFAKLNLAVAAEPNLSKRTKSNPEKRAPGTGRQAGSAFKPFALAAALADGTSLGERYKSSGCMDFSGANAGGNWHVCNYSRESKTGQISLLEATVFSVNVVYAQVILDVGPQAVVELADRMGINTSLGAFPSAVLGSNEVNPLGMASGYGTLATNGLHHPPVAITKIVDSTNGKVVYKDDTQPYQALDPAAAYLTTSTLQQVITRGTGTAAAYVGRSVAGKTGTAQEYRDAWFAGYTPDLAAAVWVGYPDGAIEMKTSCYATSTSTGRETCRPTRIQVSGGSWPTQIWAAFMARALEGVPTSPFEVPAGAVRRVTIDTRTGCLASKSTPDEYREEASFALGSEPQSTCPISTGDDDDDDDDEDGGNRGRGRGRGNRGGGGGGGGD